MIREIRWLLKAIQDKKLYTKHLFWICQLICMQIHWRWGLYRLQHPSARGLRLYIIGMIEAMLSVLTFSKEVINGRNIFLLQEAKVIREIQWHVRLLHITALWYGALSWRAHASLYQEICTLAYEVMTMHYSHSVYTKEKKCNLRGKIFKWLKRSLSRPYAVHFLRFSQLLGFKDKFYSPTSEWRAAGESLLLWH